LPCFQHIHARVPDKLALSITVLTHAGAHLLENG
jgi:hypothetical protein